MAGTSCSRQQKQYPRHNEQKQSGNGCVIMLAVVVALAGIALMLSGAIH